MSLITCIVLVIRPDLMTCLVQEYDALGLIFCMEECNPSNCVSYPEVMRKADAEGKRMTFLLMKMMQLALYCRVFTKP